MKLFTIGFTRKSAEQFFTTLAQAKVARIADVRLNNISQLAGFSKRDDLRYFGRSICGIDYIHLPALAPEQTMLDEYRKNPRNWDEYERRFLALIKSRAIESILTRDQLDNACLLCSEDRPEHCHRRIVAEYLRDAWADVEIIHL